MATEAPTAAPNWSLLRRLRTALPMRARSYVSGATHKILEVMAVRADSQPEFLFFQLAATVSTLSRRVVIRKGPNLPVSHPNQFTAVVASPKAGKTNGLKFVEPIRRRLYTATGVDNDIPMGTSVGVYNHTVRCARRGGLPLHAPDEGISSVLSLLVPSAQTNFKGEVFLSSAWSGTDVSRALANSENKPPENARLSILAMGTLADITEFHRFCKKHYADRGLLGRFCTVYAPAYSARCVLPIAEDLEEDSLLALNSAELSHLVGDALLNVFRQVEAPNFPGFHLADAAVAFLDGLRTQEAAEQAEPEGCESWSDALANRLLAHVKREFRFTEMVEKWALTLHVLELMLGAINFVERNVNAFPLETTISLATVEAARALVARAQEQDAFFVQVITSESFTDRCYKLNLDIPFDEMAAACQALATSGTLTRAESTTRFTCPGIFKQQKRPRQSFRFFKTHPDLLDTHFLDEMGIELKLYSDRYHMDYFQVQDAQALRQQRNEKKFNEWTEEIPDALMPPEVSGSDIAAANDDHPETSAAGFPVFAKHAKFHHETPALRFGRAAEKKVPAKRRRLASEETQQLFRLPGEPTFSNHVEK